ncbi:hypothetical protein EWC03_18335 [Salmonella enterica subsp. enterica serovar Alachua]|nr:hypothetical protein [Salmonella enterica subsp. enterica serovar Alachua]
MRELIDDIFTNTSLELSSTVVNDLIGQPYPAKLMSVGTIKPEDYPDNDIIDCIIDEYTIASYASRVFFVLNSETSVILIYKLISGAELEVVADHIRLIASTIDDFADALFGDSWPLQPLFAYFPLFKHGIGLIRHTETLPDNVELSLLGPGIDLYPLKDEGTLYGLRIYVSVLEGYRVIELIASDLAKQIPEAETISKATHLVEINLGDPLLKYHKEIDLRRIATTRGWGCAEVTNGYLLLIKTA